MSPPPEKDVRPTLKIHALTLRWAPAVPGGRLDGYEFIDHLGCRVSIHWECSRWNYGWLVSRNKKDFLEMVAADKDLDALVATVEDLVDHFRFYTERT